MASESIGALGIIVKYLCNTFCSHSNCGIPDPSWAEIRHFVSFLNSQLRDCEQSFFCDMQLMRSVLAGPNVLNLEGFRSFVVRFMIQMSRVRYCNNLLHHGSLWQFACRYRVKFNVPLQLILNEEKVETHVVQSHSLHFLFLFLYCCGCFQVVWMFFNRG